MLWLTASTNRCDFLPQAQAPDFDIIFVEQTAGLPFNKGALFNAGYLFTAAEYTWMALHDVDQLPETTANSYAKPARPMHMIARTTQFGNRAVFEDIAGGATLMTHEMYNRTGGFSNCFWGWGAEDINMAERVARVYGKFPRVDPAVGRYRALEHKHLKRLDKTKQYRANEQQTLDAARDGLGTLAFSVVSKRKVRYARCTTTGYTVEVHNRCNLLNDTGLAWDYWQDKIARVLFFGALLGLAANAWRVGAYFSQAKK